jgi:hypothetical protein
MALTRTTHDEVRATLGVSDEELENATLDLKVFTDQLELELSDIDPTLPTTLDTITAIAEGSRTAAQAKLFNIANIFCSYAYAKVLLTSLPLFSPKTITDGRAEFERHINLMDDVRDGISAGYSALRTRLQDALAALGSGYTAPVATTIIFATSIGLATDPVTA